MSTTFAQPVNNFSATLASGHTAGSGTLVLSSSPGTLAAGRRWRVTVVANPDTPSEIVQGIFEATGNTGATLTGVTAVEGFTDSTLLSGTPIQIRITAKAIAEVQTAVNALETTVTGNQTANRGWFGPASGAAAAPTFRAMVAADLPAAIKRVYLSSTVASDAAGAIGYGSTAPTTTDQTAAVQAAVTAAAGGLLIWDVAVGLSAPILIPSNITIEAPSRACGAILRAAANCPMFRLAGMATDATTSKQNTFGKLDPAHAGNAAYRVLDPVNFVNNRSIALRGGTWNGNRAQQTSDPFTATYGFLAIVQFYGCEDVLLEGCMFWKPRSAIPVHFCNWHRVTIRDCEVDNSPLVGMGSSGGSAGFQFNGPGRHLRMFGPIAHADDDDIALNADDSNATAINNTYASSASVCTPGVNWVQCGDITDVRIYGHLLGTGIEGTLPYGCYRMFSAVHLIDDVIIDGTSGNIQGYANIIGPAGGLTQLLGPGNLGRIDFLNYGVTLSNPLNNTAVGIGTATFEIHGSTQSIRILDRKMGDVPASAVPDVNLADPDAQSPTVRSLVLTGDYDSTTGNAFPKVKCSIPADSITVEARVRTLLGSASPVLLTAAGANIGRFDFTGDVNGPTNVIKHAAGTLMNAFLRGSHRNANGGSPIDVASGLTVTNGWYKDLAYNHGTVAFKSGAGAIVNDNDYTESIAIYAEDDFTAADGTLLVGRTPSPVSPGNNWALFEGTSANITIQSNAARIDSSSGSPQGISLQCGHADGTLTASVIINALTPAGGMGLFFRATDASNYWFIYLTNSNQVQIFKTVAGAGTLMGNLVITSDTAAHTLKAVLAGSAISIYYDTTLVTTLSDSFQSTATIHGVRTYNVISVHDTFKMVP